MFHRKSFYISLPEFQLTIVTSLLLSFSLFEQIKHPM